MIKPSWAWYRDMGVRDHERGVQKLKHHKCNC